MKDIVNWLINAATIANPIATLIAPIIYVWLNVWLIERKNQPVATPDVNQLKKRSHRIGPWLSRILRSPLIVPPILFLANVANFIYYAHRYYDLPVTGKAVVNLSFPVVGIILSTALMLHLSLASRVDVLASKEAIRGTVETLQTVVDQAKNMRIDMEAMVKSKRQAARRQSKREGKAKDATR
jgi:hypothetical protein